MMLTVSIRQRAVSIMLMFIHVQSQIQSVSVDPGYHLMVTYTPTGITYIDNHYQVGFLV